jgi:hypothetical protein
LFALKLVIDPLAFIHLDIILVKEFTLAIALPVCEISYVIFAAGQDVAAIAMHQVLGDLALVDGAVVHHVATDSLHVVIVVKLTAEVCKFL